jgi:hypothetical protein
MKIIVTESQYKILSEGGVVKTPIPNLTFKSENGWIKDNRNNYGCIKVSPDSWLVGDFALGVKNLTPNNGGGITISWGGDNPGKFDMTNSELKQLSKDWNEGRDYKKTKQVKGHTADITIGKGVRNWCKSQWS